MNVILARQGQGEKKKMDKKESYIRKLNPSRYFWTRGWRVTKWKSIHTDKIKSTGARVEPLGQIQ